MNKQELIDSIDATYLKFNFPYQEFRSKIEKNRFKNICLYPMELRHFEDWDNHTKISVFNFPFAASNFDAVMSDMTFFNSRYDEADIVMPHSSWIIEKQWNKYYGFSIEALIYMRDKFSNKILKGIIEEGGLKHQCEILMKANFDYVKTYTGFGPDNVTVDLIKQIKDVVGNKIKIKASGGIRTLDQLMTLKEAGASRFGIGIDSAINIIKELD